MYTIAFSLVFLWDSQVYEQVGLWFYAFFWAYFFFCWLALSLMLWVFIFFYLNVFYFAKNWMVCLIKLFNPSMHWTQLPITQRQWSYKSYSAHWPSKWSREMFHPLCFMNVASHMNHFSLLVSIYMAAQVPMCTYKLPSKQECFQGLIGKLVKAKTCAKNKHPKWNNELG